MMPFQIPTYRSQGLVVDLFEYWAILKYLGVHLTLLCWSFRYWWDYGQESRKRKASRVWMTF